MIKIQKLQSGGLVEIPQFERNAWISVINPSQTEVDFLKRDFHVSEDFINDILDTDERPRTEIEGRWFLILFRIPIHNPQSDIPFSTMPLGILIAVNAIITICLSENDVVRSLYLQKNKNFSLENKINFVLHSFLFSATFFLRYLKEINKQITVIEKTLEQTLKNEYLKTMMQLEKSLVYFMASLRSNELLINKLQKSKFVNTSDLDEDFLEDVIIETHQAVEMSRIYSDILSKTITNFASMISNNVNFVMKQLTSITIILMIPTLVASIYGMNVPNYVENNPHAFWMVLLLSFALSVMGVLIFWKRKLF